ncbi:hypothetical protein PR202_ga01890 [Eleusine coracana subsp. coracana]|uniref:Transmembrane protein n=1 Tax=Eleusine coracana subsp. coracana TaxID=191504 RepID=A0AAV5BI88_ELECO|nr:hypothetical protein PR202_ga01203 [Eleusine coracana subsp. coracana]GJM86072.1 hypothetical protein PR202_ga01890 [Eleusine coracana subsp. coracana]
METGFWTSVWSFIKFLPFFFGLFLLGIIKVVGIIGSILAGFGYGFLAPVMATFDAVGEGKEKPLIHCFLDGTWSTITGSCTVVRDMKDMLLHSYFSIMDEIRLHAPPDGKPYEIRLLHIPGSIFAAVCGLVVDSIMFTLIALYKFPVMLFKGWKRLIEDLVGREGPFLETACVPFAGLAILLWPFAVLGAFLASIICSIPFGAYAAVVVYQLLDHLFTECKHHGKDLVAEGVITPKDIEATKAGKVSSGILNVGLPAYVILKSLLRSAKANCDGLILSGGSVITSDNRPKSKIFEWFFDPLMVIKEQIKAENFTDEEESYLGKHVLLISDPKRLKENLPHLPSLNEQKQAEIDAFARRLQGITKSISRYPTFKRRFDALVKALSEELARTMGGSQSANGSQVRKMRSGIIRMLSQRSLGKTTTVRGDDQEAQLTSGS